MVVILVTSIVMIVYCTVRMVNGSNDGGDAWDGGRDYSSGSNSSN